jgi:hypothetical protein
MTENHPPRRLGSARVTSVNPFRDDRERIQRVRQAAEALFKPKPQVTEQVVSDSVPSVDASARQPRFLAIPPTAPVRREDAETPVSLKQQNMPTIPVSQFARIRTLVKYGMTVPEVAKVYGVPVGEIERTLRKA